MGNGIPMPLGEPLKEDIVYEANDALGVRKLVVPAGQPKLHVGDPIPILLDVEARTRTRLRDGRDPVWFLRLHNHFRQKSAETDGVSFAEYVARRHPDKVDVLPPPQGIRSDQGWPGNTIEVFVAYAREDKELQKELLSS